MSQRYARADADSATESQRVPARTRLGMTTSIAVGGHEVRDEWRKCVSEDCRRRPDRKSTSRQSTRSSHVSPHSYPLAYPPNSRTIILIADKETSSVSGSGDQGETALVSPTRWPTELLKPLFEECGYRGVRLQA